MKRIEIDGRFYRERRGVLVEIPGEWVGQVVHPQTIRKRDSKLPSRKLRHGKYRRPSKQEALG